MDELRQIIEEAPLAGSIPLVLAIFVGLLLWAAGRRVLRAGFAAAGLALGGGVGWAIGSAWTLGVSPWITATIVGLVAACLGVLVYRFALAAALALVAAIAGPGAVLTVGEIQGLERPGLAQTAPAAGSAEAAPTPQERIRDELTEFFEGPGDDAEATDAPLTDGGLAKLGLGDETAERVAQVESKARRLADAARGWWETTPPSLRPAIIAAAITGAVAGLLLGTLAPMLTATIVSAFGGSLLALTGARLLATHFVEPGALPDSAAFTGGLWLITALVGVAIQWTFRPKPADTGG